MRELMSKQSPAIRSMRRILALGEGNILAYCIGFGPKFPGRIRSLGINVYAYAAEIVAETRLHQGACFSVQSMAGRAQYLMNTCGCRSASDIVGCWALQ